MRQSGILAGAALFALDNQLKRLQADHEHAKILANGLQSIDGITCDASTTDTNLVFFVIDKMLGDGASLCRKLRDNGIMSEALDSQKIRYVTHLDVTREEIERAIQITAETVAHGTN